MLAERVVQVSRVVADLERAEDFYTRALGFRPVDRVTLGSAERMALGLRCEAEAMVMVLGSERISLVQCALPGLAMPRNSRSNDVWFQHLAIVTSDMAAAYRMLSRMPGWSAITQGPPQALPAQAGGVVAFKFRDPDGHPLELLWFPPGQGRAVWQRAATRGPNLGIDHTALAVSSTAASLRFYRKLGFRAVARTLNRGAAQARLDGIPNALLRVVGLRASSARGAGLELLGYRPPGRPMRHPHPTDMVTDWTTVSMVGLAGKPRVMLDPDGHRMLLVAAG